MAGTTAVPGEEAGAGFDAIAALVNSASPDALYTRATAFDHAAERLEDILKRFQNVSRDLQLEWAGLVANAYTDLAATISNGTSSVVDAMLGPGWAKQLRSAGDALAVGQSRIRDLAAQRAAITEPMLRLQMEPVFVAAAQQILESVSSSYQQAGTGMTPLPAGTTSGSGQSDGSDPGQQGQGDGQPQVETVAYTTPLTGDPTLTTGDPSIVGGVAFRPGSGPGSGFGAQTPFAQTPFAQTPFAQTPFTQTPFTQTPFTQTPFGQASFGQSQFGSAHAAVGAGAPGGVPAAAGSGGQAYGVPTGITGGSSGVVGRAAAAGGQHLAEQPGAGGQGDGGADGTGAFAVSRSGVPGVVGQPTGRTATRSTVPDIGLPDLEDAAEDRPGGFPVSAPSMPGRTVPQERKATSTQPAAAHATVQQPDGGSVPGASAGQRDDALAVIAAGAPGPSFTPPQQVATPQQLPQHAVAGGQPAFAQAAAGNLPAAAGGSGVVGSNQGALTGLSTPDARVLANVPETPRAGVGSWSNPVTTASVPVRPLTTDLSTVAGGSPMLPGSGSSSVSGRAGLPLDHLANSSPMPMSGMGGTGGMGMGGNQQEREPDRRYDVAFFDEDAEAWGAQDGAPPAIGRPDRRC